MDCVFVRSRVAAFFDGELDPAEVEQFSFHIENCDVCAQVVVRMEAQRFLPLTKQEKSEVCGVAGFWSDMDTTLTAQMEYIESSGSIVVNRWYSRRVGLPAPMLVAYAAAMLLAVAWGMQQRERALSAEVSAEHLGQQLEQVRRLAAQPAPSQGKAGSGQFKVVTYTPESGTF